MSELTALILGGGRGTRMEPLTNLRAKPAVPIAGKFRLIDIPISNCIQSGIRHMFILTQFNTESLHRHIHNTYRFDNFTRGYIRILAAQQTAESQDWYQGTADAVRKNLLFFESADDNIIILSGDHLYRMNYREFFKYHLEREADITIAVKPIHEEEAHKFCWILFGLKKSFLRILELNHKTVNISHRWGFIFLKNKSCLISLIIMIWKISVVK
jgi:glucose-1-phosphate adenylyltransferase